MPNQFVIKCTHDSGGLVICKDKNTFDKKAARTKIEGCLKRNFYYYGREWVYKNITPRILVEQYMEDKETGDLRDYKFFTFNGVAKALFIATERQDNSSETKFDFFDMDFKHLDLRSGHPNSKKDINKPATFDEMRTLAECLSKNIPHLRVDFYEINGRVYFGELTFAHWSGMVPFDPPEWDAKFGRWLKLPDKK